MKSLKKSISLLLIILMFLTTFSVAPFALAVENDSNEFSIDELRIFNGASPLLLSKETVWDNVGTTGNTVTKYFVEGKEEGSFYAYTEGKKSFKIASMADANYYKVFLRVTGKLPSGVAIEDVYISVSQTSVKKASIINEDGTFIVYINEDTQTAHNGFQLSGTLKLTFKLNDGTEHYFFIETDRDSNDKIMRTHIFDLTNNEIKEDSTVVDSSRTFLALDWSALGDVVLAPQVVGKSDKLGLADLVENTLIVNGEVKGTFQTASDGTSASGIKGSGFALSPGRNIVEIVSNLNGVMAVRTLAPVTNRAQMNLKSVVYILEGGNGSSAVIPPADQSDNAAIAYIGAYEPGSQLVIEGECEVYQSNNDYIVYTTKGYTLINVKLSDSNATLNVVDETNLNNKAKYLDSFVVIGALNEEKSVPITVIAADGVTIASYTVKVITVDTRPDTGLSSLDFGNSGATLDRPIADDGSHYTLTFPTGVSELSVEPVASSADATVEIEGGLFSSNKPINRITVTNGAVVKTYKFLTKLADGTIPMAGISNDTKVVAKDLLKWAGWYDGTQYKSNDLSTGLYYWNVFMAEAAGAPDGDKYDFNGALVYDVSKHDMKQNTDWAACILELVILGQNPYSFQGPGGDAPVDYVAGLEASENRGYANSTWYKMAAKTVGIPMTQYGSDLFGLYTKSESVINFANSDLDIGAWTAAAEAGVLSPEKHMLLMADALHGVQDTWSDNKSLFINFSYAVNNGKDPYQMEGTTGSSTGTVLSALASANVDPEIWFAVDGQTPLGTLKGRVYSPNALLTKDMVIGLGDISQGSNVWARYALTAEKYNTLQERAINLGISTASMPTFGSEGYGKAYYNLYDTIVETLENLNTAESIAEARQMRPDVQFGNQLQIFEGHVTSGNLSKAMEIYENSLTSVQHTTLYTSGTALSEYIALIKASLVGDELATFEKIAALPVSNQVTTSHKEMVNIANNAYDDLANKESFKAAVGASWIDNLESCMAIIAVIAPDNTGGGQVPEVKSVTVTFRLVGDSVHNTPENHITYENWIPKQTYTFYNVNNVSVYEVFMRAINEFGISQIGADKNYVRSMTYKGVTLSEFTNGPYSGWMYMVDGDHVNLGLQEKYVTDGQSIVWHYVDDYILEEGIWEETEPEKFPAGQGVPVKESTSSAIIEPDITTVSGTSIAKINTSDIKTAINQAIANVAETGAIPEIKVVAEVDEKATSLAVEISAAAVKSIADTGKAQLTIESKLGTIILDNGILDSIASGQPDNTIITINLTQVETSSLTPEQQEMVEDKPVYDISITSGGKKISSFDGKSITISLPYSLKEGEKASDVKVWYLNDKGQLEEIKCTYDEKTGLATFITNHLSKFMVGVDGEKVVLTLNFTDVSAADWFYDAVKFAVEKGLFKGTSETTFSPNEAMTRGMLVSVLHRLAGEPAGYKSSFTDVNENDWFAGPVAWAAANNVVSGYGQGLFGPNDKVTREQIAAILHRYAQSKGYELTKTKDLSAYKDAAAISPWAKEVLAWANAEGLINGRSADLLAPGESATRAEVAAILQRFIENVMK